ncbi:MAG: hydrolase [Alphaproteobacteria bacterium]
MGDATTNRQGGLLQAARSCLVCVDVQERLLPAMAEPETVVANGRVLLQAASRLGVPVLATEQYPKGLGRIVENLMELVPEDSVVEKVEFSCAANPEFHERLLNLERPQVVLFGIEAHVCVLQTALGLEAAGLAPYVVADAVSSRAAENRDLALGRLARAGVEAVSTEMVVFEWLGKAGTADFKALAALIK